MKKPFLPLLLLLITFSFFSFTTNPDRSTPSKAVSKSLTFPVAGAKNSIGDKWGASRDGGKRRHKGIDIYARKGTPVVAICDGQIVTLDKTPIGGKTLWLKSADHSWTAYYAHLDKQLVKEGDYVRKGQVIGTVGNTGNALTTPSHLHFGISPGNGWVNPLPYVKYSPKVPIRVSSKKSVAKKHKQAKRRTRR